eukprot:gene2499-5455_t
MSAISDDLEKESERVIAVVYSHLRAGRVAVAAGGMAVLAARHVTRAEQQPNEIFNRVQANLCWEMARYLQGVPTRTEADHTAQSAHHHDEGDEYNDSFNQADLGSKADLATHHVKMKADRAADHTLGAQVLQDMDVTSGDARVGVLGNKRRYGF